MGICVDEKEYFEKMGMYTKVPMAVFKAMICGWQNKRVVLLVILE
jgi:hypothetical protein